MDEPEPDAACSSCYSTQRVAWAPLDGEWLCEPCRLGRTDRLLKQHPVTAIPVPPQ
jgi:hypothetical protein